MALDKYGYNAIARHVFTGVLGGALMFLGAGTTDWPEGWWFAVTYTVCWTVLSVVLARVNPGLLNARGKRSTGAGTKSWDWPLLAIYALMTPLQPFVAGLDHRYGWSPPASGLVTSAGVILMIAAFGLLTWSMAANRHFEPTARIQSERDHQVTTGGPYRYIRHPGYSAVVATFVAVAMIPGSWAAFAVGLAGAAVFVVRTRLEDRMLLDELPGYAQFAERTRWRLLPGVW